MTLFHIKSALGAPIYWYCERGKKVKSYQTKTMKLLQNSSVQLLLMTWSNPECIVLHCCTNDLRQNTSAVEIGQKILELVLSCKSDSSNILSLELINYMSSKLNAKAAQVNSFLKNECGKINTCFVNNSNKAIGITAIT